MLRPGHPFSLALNLSRLEMRLPWTHVSGIGQDDSRQVCAVRDITIHNTIFAMPNSTFRSLEGVHTLPRK